MKIKNDIWIKVLSLGVGLAVGLAVSLAFVIIIGSYVWQQYAVTRENPDRERIYVPGIPGFPALTYGFPDAIMDIPEIESVSRMCTLAEHPVIRGEQTDAKSIGVEPDFFEICPQFRFMEGSADVLSDPSNVIVSASFARKHDLSVGDAIGIGGDSYVVAAILEDLRGTAIKPYDIFRNAAVYRGKWQLFDNFGSTTVLFKARPGTDRKDLYDKLEAVCKDVYSDCDGLPQTCTAIGHNRSCCSHGKGKGHSNRGRFIHTRGHGCQSRRTRIPHWTDPPGPLPGKSIPQRRRDISDGLSSFPSRQARPLPVWPLRKSSGKAGTSCRQKQVQVPSYPVLPQDN